MSSGDHKKITVQQINFGKGLIHHPPSVRGGGSPGPENNSWWELVGQAESVERS